MTHERIKVNYNIITSTYSKIEDYILIYVIAITIFRNNNFI